MAVTIIKTFEGYRINGKEIIKDQQGNLIPPNILTEQEEESLKQHLLSL